MSPAAGLTLLSTPKRFSGIFDVIQTNAITSWTKLAQRPEIILFGRDEGTAELCEELGLIHVADVETTSAGTPLLSDMFMRGQQMASNKVVCWSNADLIFTDSLLDAADIVRRQHRPAYLVGRRRDIEQPNPLDFNSNWQATLAERAHRSGELKPANWVDYFMFNRGLFPELPPFAIGRPGYDLWLIWRAADLGAEIIDATAFVDAIHQRHDYSHVGSRSMAFTGPEAQQNAAIVDDWHHYHSISYASLRLDYAGRLTPARELRYRLARPRSHLAHALRFTRPIRRRLLGERATMSRRRA